MQMAANIVAFRSAKAAFTFASFAEREATIINSQSQSERRHWVQILTKRAACSVLLGQKATGQDELIVTNLKFAVN